MVNAIFGCLKLQVTVDAIVMDTSCLATTNETNKFADFAIPQNLIDNKSSNKLELEFDGASVHIL